MYIVKQAIAMKKQDSLRKTNNLYETIKICKVEPTISVTIQDLLSRTNKKAQQTYRKVRCA